jgi:hypothetical protein
LRDARGSLIARIGGRFMSRFQTQARVRFDKDEMRMGNLNLNKDGGRNWIRTNEGVSQQIYSLPPLATWVSYRPARNLRQLKAGRKLSQTKGRLSTVCAASAVLISKIDLYQKMCRK